MISQHNCTSEIPEAYIGALGFSTSTVKLKLLIDKKGNKVLFAESSKDFVDFLFYLLSLPVGTVVKLLKPKSLVGALGKLYESIENLNEAYIQPNQNKNTLLNPTNPLFAAEVPLLLTDNQESNTRKVYLCPCNHQHVADIPNVTCPHCKVVMNIETLLSNLQQQRQGLNLLKASLECKNVLTGVYLGNKL
ncbi:hypothetical protein Ddye_018994 [Dipteronia dyeriana]|uniref:DUF674 domain-containing protein n=1 Tax=Dipteronia dyeriana TaxID=168575 RepID=A0AAD9WU09_9ROSI|nr:hypothetical protein Ddye_018994 [Dipteronia dyeriana]